MLDPPHLPAVGGSPSEKLRAERAAERAATGFCLVGHPTAHAARRSDRAGAGTLADALGAEEPGPRLVSAVVRQVVEKRTKRGDWWASLWLEDARTRCEASCFPAAWSRVFPAVFDGDGSKPDADRVLFLTVGRDREPGRLVVEAAETADPAVLAASPAASRLRRLAELRDALGDFVVVDTETTFGPPDSGVLGLDAASFALAQPAKAARGRGGTGKRGGASEGPGGAPARVLGGVAGIGAGGPVGGAAGAAEGGSDEPERDEWLARQRVVELGAVFFKRVRGRAPRRGEGAGSDGLVPQWVEFRRVARFVNPGCPIDDDSRRVHGIGDEKVAGQPTFGERAADLARVLSAWPTVVTYNGSRFDVPVLLREFARAKVAPPRTLLHPHLDLADLAARRYPGRPTRPASNKLGDQCAYWGVPLVGAHRADADAAATGAMLVRMVQDGAEL